MSILMLKTIHFSTQNESSDGHIVSNQYVLADWLKVNHKIKIQIRSPASADRCTAPGPLLLWCPPFRKQGRLCKPTPSSVPSPGLKPTHLCRSISKRQYATPVHTCIEHLLYTYALAWVHIQVVGFITGWTTWGFTVQALNSGYSNP